MVAKCIAMTTGDPSSAYSPGVFFNYPGTNIGSVPLFPASIIKTSERIRQRVTVSPTSLAAHPIPSPHPDTKSTMHASQPCLSAPLRACRSPAGRGPPARPAPPPRLPHVPARLQTPPSRRPKRSACALTGARPRH